MELSIACTTNRPLLERNDETGGKQLTLDSDGRATGARDYSGFEAGSYLRLVDFCITQL